MSFLNLTLLAGVLAIAIPIALHLIMRREPQRLEFPALRFVRQRQQTNQRRLRLRHWLLLALRCGVLALLAMALARPVLWGDGLRGKPNTDTAIGFVVDNSLGMTYQQDGSTRLDEALDEATWLVEQLPANALATVVDRSTQRSPRLGDRDAAMLRLERIAPATPRRSLAEATSEVIGILSETSGATPSVYVFTDQSKANFDEPSLDTLAEALEKLPNAKIHFVDVGVNAPRNRGLTTLELSTERPSAGEPLTIRTGVYGTTEGDTASSVEVWLAERGSEPTKRADKPASETLEFTLAGLAAGVHQGFIRLMSTDALPNDNTRYFTVEVVEPPTVLLVEAEPGGAIFVSEALAPSALAGVIAPRFICETVTVGRLRVDEINEFDAVVLLDPPPLAESTWRALAEYAQSGGGVAVCLGGESVGKLAEMNSTAAQLVLPGKLKWTSRTPRYLQPRSYEHPILRELADVAGETPWPLFPVFQAWQFDSLDSAASIVSYFADGSPAIVEQTLGSGRVVVVTTPFSDRATASAWNLLPTNPEPWPFLALVNGLADYLVGTATHPLNYTAGQSVVLPLPRRSDLSSFVLTPPEGEPLVQSLDPMARDIVLSVTSEVGNYRVTSGGTQSQFERGFSTNVDDSAGRLERADFSDIESRLGRDRVTRASSRSDISSTIDLAATGRELFPWIITCVALMLAAEQILANRFYASSPSRTGVGGRGRGSDD